MIVGHGIDLQEISAIKKAYDKRSTFAKKVLTEREFDKFQTLKGNRQITFLAGRWAAKEAFAKADEISIFLNGLFLGLREHEGYSKDISYGAIRLTSPGTIDRIVSDPLQTYLMSHPDARNRYKMTHHDKDYVPPKKTMILEWR